MNDRALAGPAGVFGTAGYDHLVLRRHNIEPPGDVFADPMQDARAAGADALLRFQNDLDLSQMVGKRGPLLATLASPVRLERGIGPLLRLLDLGQTLDEVLEGQIQLVLVQPLRASAELQPLQGCEDVLIALVPRLDLGDLSLELPLLGLQPLQFQALCFQKLRCIAVPGIGGRRFRALGEQQRMGRFEGVRQIVRRNVNARRDCPNFCVRGGLSLMR